MMRSLDRHMPAKKKIKTVTFIESMECLPVAKLPDGPEWTYEIKLDGFRLETVKNSCEPTLYSRRRNILNRKFPYIAAALKDLPDATVIDGELVALDAEGLCSRTHAELAATTPRAPLDRHRKLPLSAGRRCCSEVR
jgi:ATP-dependent DNA ligase